MSTADSPLPSDPPLPLIAMGVSGCGKTTFGKALAAALGLPFYDGDDFHSPAAKAKMASGTPLTDADRAPWLDRIGAALADTAQHPRGAVVACSALRKAYRDRLRAAAGPKLRFLFLDGDEALMTQRVGDRKGHYMPASLVESQFATLERPDGEADVIRLDAAKPVADLVQDAAAALGRDGPIIPA